MRKKKDYRNKRLRRLTKHHLIPKERVKLNTVPEDEIDRSYSKVLILWRNRHDYWHYLFGNLTIGEIVKVLQRIERIKYK